MEKKKRTKVQRIKASLYNGRIMSALHANEVGNTTKGGTRLAELYKETSDLSKCEYTTPNGERIMLYYIPKEKLNRPLSRLQRKIDNMKFGIEV